MAQYRLPSTITFCLLLAWSGPALAAPGDNPSTDMVVGLSVAAGVLIALLIVLCVLAQCVPGLCCGRARKDETWFNDSNASKDLPSPPTIQKPSAPIVHPMYK
ncbi:uncharacterized protein PG998_008860 [Apiospora kogelbergensis]|uniref:uncharacterized protein n=1 Tax=Apiospora kogelbergensis TaxID=1337665 RepID=UPI00312DA385